MTASQSRDLRNVPKYDILRETGKIYSVYFLALPVGLGIALPFTELELRLSGVALALTGAVAAGFEGVLKDGVAADFLVSGNDEMTGLSKTGKKDNFLTGAHIWSSISRHTSSDIVKSLTSSLSTARLNSFISTTGGKATFEIFCIAEDETEEFTDDAAVIVDDREIGTCFVFFAAVMAVEEETFFKAETVFARATGFG